MRNCNESKERNRLRQFGAALAILAAGACSAATGSAAPISSVPTIATEVSLAGSGGGGSAVYRYTYLLSGFDFLDTPASGDYELDVQFDPSNYGTLSNAMAGPDFTVLLFQPNNPPGVQGDYILLADVNHASLGGTFSVDFTWTGPGSPLDLNAPIAQPFYIDSFDSSGNCISCPLEGPFSTTPVSASAVPEPATSTLVLPGIVICGALWMARRRNARRSV